MRWNILSRQYFVRDRGRTMGPFTREQLFDMRDRGQLHAYHEVSTDKVSWRAFDLVFPPPGSAPVSSVPVSTSTGRAPKGMRKPPPGQNRLVWYIAGGVGALVAIAGVVIAGLLIFRKSETPTNPDVVPEGVIAFHGTTTTRARDNAVADSVALVVPGMYFKYNDGSWSEVRLGHGSGFAVSPDGHIITNRHVIEDINDFKSSKLRTNVERKIDGNVEARIWVFFGRDSKHEVDLESVYVSVDYDLAILKVKHKTPRYFALSRTEDSRIPMLDAVSSLGFPNTDQKASKIFNPNQPVTTGARNSPVQRGFLDADFNVTKENGGIKKNSFRGRVPESPDLEANYLVHTARIAPGNSGGPLIAKDGTVLGINTLGILDPRSKEKVIQEGQNFALTMPQLRKEIDQRVPNVTWRDAPE
jgi:S1-C subfamily serine protease